MITFDYGLDIAILVTFIGVGLWLEGINGKHGVFDELLTWFPFGIAGAAVLIERTWG